MIPQTENTLKGYFATGNKPTQAEFEELVATMFHHDAENAAAADNAQDAADDLAPFASKAWAKLNWSGTAWQIKASQGVASVSGTAASLTVTFTTSFPTSDYVVMATTTVAQLPLTGVPLVTMAQVAVGNQAAGAVTLVLAGITTNGKVHVVAFGEQ